MPKGEAKNIGRWTEEKDREVLVLLVETYLPKDAKVEWDVMLKRLGYDMTASALSQRINKLRRCLRCGEAPFEHLGGLSMDPSTNKNSPRPKAAAEPKKGKRKVNEASGSESANGKANGSDDTGNDDDMKDAPASEAVKFEKDSDGDEEKKLTMG